MNESSSGGVRARLRAEIAHNRTVLVNAGSMMSTVLVTALLGAAFWLIAARNFTPDAVGVASAAVSAMMLLGYLATVGLGTLLMGELPRRDEHHRGLLNAALAVSGAIGVVLGLGFAFVAPLVSSDLGPLSETWLAALVFAAGVGLTGLAGVLDQALIGLMRGGLQLIRNVAFSVVKLVALILAGLFIANPGGVWIYTAWTAGIALSLAAMGRFYMRRGEDGLWPRFGLLGEMRVDAATHHIYNLSIRTPDLILPLIVVSMLSATANANFYIAWMIASFGFMVPVSLSSVLYAVGSGNPHRLFERYRLSVALSASLGLAANLILLVAGGPILSLFGASYEQQALGTLHILALGVFPETIKAHYLSISRVERRISKTIPLVIGGTILELAGALAGGSLGNLAWVAAGWLGAVCVEAAVMSRDVFRFLRLVPRQSAEPPRRRGSGPCADESADLRRCEP
jgi:O-antigen/teichoic acid export membrane protein